MKKFTFELEKVLEYRNFEKQQAEGELAKAISVETEINDNLKKIAQNYAAVKDKNFNSKRSVHCNIHSSTIYNSQDTEAN